MSRRRTRVTMAVMFSWTTSPIIQRRCKTQPSYRNCTTTTMMMMTAARPLLATSLRVQQTGMMPVQKKFRQVAAGLRSPCHSELSRSAPAVMPRATSVRWAARFAVCRKRDNKTVNDTSTASRPLPFKSRVTRSAQTETRGPWKLSFEIGTINKTRIPGGRKMNARIDEARLPVGWWPKETPLWRRNWTVTAAAVR